MSAVMYPRIRIAGVIELLTPMSLGDGGVEGGKADGQGGAATVLRAPNNRAVIPGSSLKGALRGYLTARGCREAVLHELFGRESLEKSGGGTTADPGQGGKVEFGCAYSPPLPALPKEQFVSIDRVTRAASEQKLFATQVVPAGTAFPVELLGFGLRAEAVAALLEMLDSIRPDADPPLSLGSGAANEYGLVRWIPVRVQVLTHQAIADWLNQAQPSADPWSVAEELQTAQLPQVTTADRRPIRVHLRLNFQGWFLVKDPDASKPKDGGGPGDGENRKWPDAFPRLTSDGRVLLPVRSFRGALRSQVERIAHTLNGAAGGDPHRPVAQQIVECLFGDTRGRASVRCSRFVDSRAAWIGTPGEPIPADVAQRQRTPVLRREFVAIDRFTGGAAEHLKFDAVAAWRPSLEGRLAIDLESLVRQGQRRQVPPAAALGLLVLGLRDLCDGDVAFGFGGGKGFGQCTADVAGFAVSDAAAVAEQLNVSPDQWNRQLQQERERASPQGPFGGLAADVRALLALAVAEARTYLLQPAQVRP